MKAVSVYSEIILIVSPKFLLIGTPVSFCCFNLFWHETYPKYILFTVHPNFRMKNIFLIFFLFVVMDTWKSQSSHYGDILLIFVLDFGIYRGVIYLVTRLKAVKKLFYELENSSSHFYPRH